MSIELLKEFAKAQNIDLKEVDKFISQYGIPKTLGELVELPKALKEDVDYISYVGEPLKSFIQDEMWCERYMTIDVERVAECLADRIYELLDSEEIDVWEAEIASLTTDDESKKDELEKLKEVSQYMLDTKFGSVVYDW